MYVKKSLVWPFSRIGFIGLLDVAYLDSPKWSHGLGDVISHVRHSKFCIISIFMQEKKNKIVVLTISLALVGRIALICICS